MFNFNININVTKSSFSISGDRKKKKKQEVGSLEVLKTKKYKVLMCLILVKFFVYIAFKHFI